MPEKSPIGQLTMEEEAQMNFHGWYLYTHLKLYNAQTH